ncbi:alpha/beta hydrolase [Pararhodonellum marinum]|uniref:alpha/beta hydrolase n=1 Tax=Pararhodonellum marinum TaxID=2755358 RepID=UPI00188F45A6|nr:alpha/beta hydrolase [Pararhodonellum marinum]
MNHYETTYKTHDGLSLYLQAWLPEKPRAAMLLVHGLGEHSTRYTHLAKKWVENGIAVYSFDGRGHGKSSLPEPTAYFDNFEDYLKDIAALLEKVITNSKGIPVFLFGHSMGGGLVTKFVIDHQPEIRGVILSGAALMPAVNVSKLLIAGSAFFGKYFPKLKVLKLDSALVSQDQEEVKKYDEDPLIYHKAIPARTGSELLKVMAAIKHTMSAFNLPVLIMHGSEDLLTNPKGSQLLHEQAGSKDKTFLSYKGFYHEIVNEIEKEKVMQDMLDWILKRI